jgi:hypothetical protein
MYSTQDPCGSCGPAIEKSLPIIKAKVMDFLAIGMIKKLIAGQEKTVPKVKVPKRFTLFTAMSSSLRHPTAKPPRPEFNELGDENTLNYGDLYRQSSSVYKGLSLKSLDGKVLRFWIPRTGDKTGFKRIQAIQRPMNSLSAVPAAGVTLSLQAANDIPVTSVVTFAAKNSIHTQGQQESPVITARPRTTTSKTLSQNKVIPQVLTKLTDLLAKLSQQDRKDLSEQISLQTITKVQKGQSGYGVGSNSYKTVLEEVKKRGHKNVE